MSRLSFITTAVERTLLAASLLLMLAVHFGGWLAPGWFHTYFPFAEAIWQLLPAAQIVLLAAWTVCRIAPLWLRLASAPVLLCMWAAWWADSLSSPTAATWLFLTGAIAAALLAAGRCCGLELASVRSSDANRHPQFSIGALIGLTTMIAATLGILQWLRPHLQTETNLSLALEQILIARSEASVIAEFLAGVSARSVVLASALAIVSLAAMACVLRPGPMWLRLVVTAVLVPLLGFYLTYLTGDDLAAGVSLAVSLSVLAVIEGISVWPLRLLGVRLIRRTGFQPVLSFIRARLKTCPTGKSHESRTSAA